MMSLHIIGEKEHRYNFKNDSGDLWWNGFCFVMRIVLIPSWNNNKLQSLPFQLANTKLFNVNNGNVIINHANAIILSNNTAHSLIIINHNRPNGDQENNDQNLTIE